MPIRRALAYLYQFYHYSVWAKHDATSLATLGMFMQNQCIGLKRWTAKKFISENWNGAETAEINDDVFLVKNDAIIKTFIFRFHITGGVDGYVNMITILSDEYPNLAFLIDDKARNFFIKDESKPLKYAEKKLCKQLLKTGVFIKGRSK